MTHHNQTKELTTWFLNLPLDDSIDNKDTKFESKTHEAQLDDQKVKKSSRKLSRRKKTAKANKRYQKRQNHERSKQGSKPKQKLKINTPLKSTPHNTLNASSPS
jgi:hypothetical protein